MSSTRKSTFFYGVLVAFASLVVGMVIASRLDLAPRSLASTLNVPATNSAPLAGPIDSTTFRTIAHDASPTVVSIVTTMKRQAPDVNQFFFGFPTPFDNQQPQAPNRNRRGQPQQRPQAPEQFAQGAGSGFIIDKAGYILTNNHVVEDETSIEVFLSGEEQRAGEGLNAKVVGRDELTDVALLQLTETPPTLVESKFGDSSQMQPGDWVMAIGNPFQLSNTVTVGVVSAVGRQNQVASGRFEDFIQTDAAINRGNSGGPLLNIRGEVIGINTMIVTDQGQGNVGVGFAVPINSVRDLLPQLRTGKVTRGRIGVSVDRRAITKEYAAELGLAPGAGGAEINSVEPETPASRAGIRAGDVITEWNGKAVKDSNDLVSMVTHTAPGTTVPVKVLRDKKAVTLNVKVEELDLQQESARVASSDDQPRGGTNDQPKETSFGMTLAPLTSRDRQDLHLTADRGGALVTDVTPFGPAQLAGIAENDVIVSVGSQTVKSLDATTAALDAVASGTTARLIVARPTRTGDTQEIAIRLRRK